MPRPMSDCPERHGPSCLRDCPSCLRDHRERLVARHRHLGTAAEDLASEALIRALERPPADGKAEAWVEGILRHLLADHSRRHARSTRALTTLRASPPEAPATPEEALLAAERHRLLRRALPALPPQARALLHQRFWEEGDDADLAGTHGIARPTIRSRVHRALRHLHRLLAPLRGLLPVLPFGPQPAALALLPLVLATQLAAPSDRVPVPAPLPVPVRDPVAPVRLPPAAPAPPTPIAVPTKPPPAPRPAPPAVLRMTFDDDDIPGDLHRPDDVLVVGPPARTAHPSLVEIPSSFTAALTKMIEDL